MFQYEHETEWVMPQEYPDLSDAREVAIDLETYDPHLKTKGSGWATGSGHVIGVAVASDKGQWYFPIRHQNGPNLDPKMTLRWVKDLCSQEHTTFVFHNAMYDMGWLKAEGIEIKGRAVDTMIAAPLIDENRFSYALNALGRDYLNETKSERLLTEAAKSMGLDPKSEMYKLPAHFVGDYAEQDAAMTLRLWRHLRGILETESLMTVFELETSVLRVILAMRERGVRVDMDKADSVKGFLQNEEEKILLDIRRVSGTEVSVWAAASVAKAFDAVGLEYPRTATGLPSFTKNFLANHGHELPKSIVRARELNKARTTFIDSITRFEHNGRIHADIHQLRSDEGGTVTGRMAYSAPNLQQIPSRDDFISPLIRGLFLPETGTLWGSFDYSSQEPRLVVHYASLIHNLYREGKGRYSMKGADVFAQKYREDPRMDFHQLAADILGVSRKHAKTCIAEGQLVLTDRGLVPIENVTVADLVWDGVEWVSHDGVLFMGVKEVLTYGNLTATPDHDVWTVQSGKIPFGVAASRLDDLVSTGDGGKELRYVDGDQAGHTEARKTPVRFRQMLLREGGLEVSGEPEEWAVHQLSTVLDEASSRAGGEPDRILRGREDAPKPSVLNLSEVQESEERRLGELRWPWDNLRVQLCQGFGGVSHLTVPCRGVGWEDDRQSGQRQGVSGREHSTSVPFSQQLQQEKYKDGLVHGSEHLPEPCLARHEDGQPRLGLGENTGHEASTERDERRRHSEEGPIRRAKVYDIVNAGPRNRFTVSGVLVSNCALGILYGMGVNKLSEQIGLDFTSGKALFQDFNASVPFVKELSNYAMEVAERNGHIRTLLGRKGRFDKWEPKAFGSHKPLPFDEAVREYGHPLKRAFTYKTLNKLIQGSAADQVKKGMVDLFNEGILPMVQIHDELAVPVESADQAKRIVEIMENCVTLEVPSIVDAEIGETWGAANMPIDKAFS